MPGSYSTDLRERVLVAVEAGEPADAVAERFLIGRSSVYRWIAAARGDPLPDIAGPDANRRRRPRPRPGPPDHPDSDPAQFRLRRHVQLAKVPFAHHGTHTCERGKGALFDRLGKRGKSVGTVAGQAGRIFALT